MGSMHVSGFGFVIRCGVLNLLSSGPKSGSANNFNVRFGIIYLENTYSGFPEAVLALSYVG